MRGFQDPTCLIPVDFFLAMTRDTGLASELLNCHAWPSRDIDMVFRNDISLQSTAWDADIEW